MKIRFTIVSSDLLTQVRAEVDILLRAVNVGDMDGADAATAKLLELTADCHSIDLSDEDWRAFLDGIRSKNPAFESNYLLPGEVCVSLLPTISAGDYILELPIDGDIGEEDVDV